jgi:hypothetical protein
MKRLTVWPGWAPGLLGLGLCVLGSGCASTRIPASYYLQRKPVRVAVMPSGNKTDHPEASIVFNKAVEEALTKRGFEVISADRVVTYASARGLSLVDLPKRKASEVGRDLKADMLLYSDIEIWKTQYAVIKSASVVAGTSRLVETPTDALVWHYAWRLQNESGSGGGGLGGLLADALVTAVASSAMDVCAGLGMQAAQITVSSLPAPGYAPGPNEDNRKP